MKPDKKSNDAPCSFVANSTLLKAIDRASGSELISRSSWVRRAVARELERGGFLPAEKPVADSTEGARQ